jgi:hypothetical protein
LCVNAPITPSAQLADNLKKPYSGPDTRTTSVVAQSYLGLEPSMSITLTPEQQYAIEQAIQNGLAGSVDEFICSAVDALSRQNGAFDRERAKLAVARIRELRKGVTLDLKGMSIRELAHSGHRY